jgi:hypothetical protein
MVVHLIPASGNPSQSHHAEFPAVRSGDSTRDQFDYT